MISKFRKGADNLFIRILLGLIAISFIGIGGASFIGSNSGGDIVSFSRVDSISFEEFQIAKAREIAHIQKQNNISLSDEEIAGIGINNSVLKKLVDNAMLDYLAGHYDLDISDEKVISQIKENSFFQNTDGIFDINRFKAAFGNSTYKEQEYISAVKREIVNSVILNIFVNNFPVPSMITDNIINYMAETRVVDILQCDLTYREPKRPEPATITEEDIAGFYDQNQSRFIIPEKRSFSYIKADKSFIEKHLKYSEQDLKAYFEENKEEFESGSFITVKNQVKEAFISEKIGSLANEFARNLEEDVAAGLTLKEIAEKYNLRIYRAEGKTLEELNSSNNNDYPELADTVYEMAEREMSYPIEIQDKFEVFVAELQKIEIARQQELKEISEEIKEILNKKYIIAENIKKLENYRKNYPSTGSLPRNIKLLANRSLVRANVLEDTNLPQDLINLIFETNVNTGTKLVVNNDKAYFAYLTDIKLNKTIASAIKTNSSKHFNALVKESVFQELIKHLTDVNKMKIKNISG